MDMYRDEYLEMEEKLTKERDTLKEALDLLIIGTISARCRDCIIDCTAGTGHRIKGCNLEKARAFVLNPPTPSANSTLKGG